MAGEQNEGTTGRLVTEDRLVFGPTKSLLPLYDDAERPVIISVQACLQGMFVLSREPLDAGTNDGETYSNGNSHPTESVLTCYRRNRFQVAGDVALSTWPRSIGAKESVEGGPPAGAEEIQESLTAELTAVETRDWTHVVILAANSRGAGEPAAIGGPTELEFTAEQCRQTRRRDLLSPPAAPGSLPLYAPFVWDRLQFRSATANNGRKRREIRQRFRVDVSIFATRKRDGTRECVARASSSLITVRGRSPKNFEARDDVPLMSVPDNRSPIMSRQRPLSGDLEAVSTTVGANTGSFAHLQQQDHPFQISLLAQPPEVLYPEAIPLEPDLTNNNQFVYSPTMWDWLDVSTTATATNLEGFVRGVPGPDETRMLGLPAIWPPATGNMPVTAVADVYDVPEGSSFQPGVVSHDKSPMQSKQYTPPAMPDLSSLSQSRVVATSLTSSTVSGAATTAGPVPETYNPPSHAALLPGDGGRRPSSPKNTVGFTSAFSTTEASSTEADSTSSQCTSNGKKRYTYIPVGIDGWQPPAEPVYWPHPWVHMHNKKPNVPVRRLRTSSRQTRWHYFSPLDF